MAEIIPIKRGPLAPLRVRVVRLSFARRERAARAMRMAGYPDSAIRLALGLSVKRLAALESTPGLWGSFAPIIAQHMREIA